MGKVYRFSTYAFMLFFSTSAFCQNVGSDLSAEQQASIEWANKFWVFLEGSDHTQFRTVAAIRLLHEDVPEAVVRGEKIVHEVLNALNPDPVSLWLLANDCQFGKTHEWCAPGGVYERLVNADPGNAAAHLLQIKQEAIGYGELPIDTERTRTLIIAAATAERFDSYWWRGADKLYEEAMEYIEINPMPPIPPPVLMSLSADITDIREESLAFMALSTLVIVSNPVPNYGNLLDYCRLQVRNRRVKSVEACSTLAQIMQTSDGTILTKRIGLSLERVMLEELNPEDPGIARLLQRVEVVTVMQLCFAPQWSIDGLQIIQTDRDRLMRWTQNLDRFGEWNGNRVTTLQEYDSNPESFSVNPHACERLKNLDDESLDQFVGDRTGPEIYRDMQDQRFGMPAVVK